MADIEHHKGGTTLTGRGIEVMRLVCLRSALKMLNHGMRLTRTATPAATMAMVEEVSGLKFGRGAKGREKAIEWLDGYIILARGACSETTEGE